MSPRIPGKNPMLLEERWGKLRYAPDAYPTQASAVWEGQILEGSLRSSFKHLTPLMGPVAQALTECGNWLVWFNPSTGVRPKLPDRESLLENQALEYGVLQVVQSLEDEVKRRWITVLNALPARFDFDARSQSGAGLQAGLSRVRLSQISDAVTEALLSVYGYLKVTVENYPAVTRENLGDQSDWTESHQTWWERDPLRLNDPRAVATHNLLRSVEEPLAVFDSEGEALTLEGVSVGLGLQRAENGLEYPLDHPTVALASTIKVGARDLPFLIDPNSNWDTEQTYLPTIHFAGGYRDALKILEAWGPQLGGAYLQALYGDYNRENFDQEWCGEYLEASAGLERLHQMLELNFADAAHKRVKRESVAVTQLKIALDTLERLENLPEELEDAVMIALPMLMAVIDKPLEAYRLKTSSRESATL